jgi:hypothetical protein
MKSKFPLAVGMVLAALLPATASAALIDRVHAQQACTTLRAGLGLATFNQTYTYPISTFRGEVGSGALGICVLSLAPWSAKARAAARAACLAEQADPSFAAKHSGKTFAQFYGTGDRRNALSRCTQLKAKSLFAQVRKNVVNGARACKAERTQLGSMLFAAKYGIRYVNVVRHAFDRCVSAYVRARNAATPSTQIGPARFGPSGWGGTGTVTLSSSGTTLRVEYAFTGLSSSTSHYQLTLHQAAGNASCSNIAATSATYGVTVEPRPDGSAADSSTTNASRFSRPSDLIVVLSGLVANTRRDLACADLG